MAAMRWLIAIYLSGAACGFGKKAAGGAEHAYPSDMFKGAFLKLRSNGLKNAVIALRQTFQRDCTHPRAEECDSGPGYYRLWVKRYFALKNLSAGTYTDGNSIASDSGG